MSMTPEETIKILTAKAECMRRETSGIDIDCNYRNCDECDLCYKQGTTGDQMEALRVAISALQAQDVPDTNVGDMISRQKAIDALCRRCDLAADDDEPCTDKCNDIKILEKMPFVQQEAISLEWIDKHLEWLDNCDNDFAQLAKVGIRAMVEIWKKDKT